MLIIQTAGSFILHFSLQGSRCETDVDECASSPCRNRATCVDLQNHYDCVCVPGFEGSVCQSNILECISFPCRNGGEVARVRKLKSDFCCQIYATSVSKHAHQVWSKLCSHVCTFFLQAFVWTVWMSTFASVPQPSTVRKRFSSSKASQVPLVSQGR